MGVVVDGFGRVRNSWYERDLVGWKLVDISRTAAHRGLVGQGPADQLAVGRAQARVANGRRRDAAIRAWRSRAAASTRSATAPRRPTTKTNTWSASTRPTASRCGRPRPARPGPRASRTGKARAARPRSTATVCMSLTPHGELVCCQTDGQRTVAQGSDEGFRGQEGRRLGLQRIGAGRRRQGSICTPGGDKQHDGRARQDDRRDRCWTASRPGIAAPAMRRS